MQQQFVLLIDTATEICSVSLCDSQQVVDVIETDVPNQHVSKLTLFIEEILQRNSVAYADLTAVAVSMGPGSYTGLRIGVSTAKGLCYSLDIPLLSVNTLEAMYAGYRELFIDDVNDLYCPMIDARRMEVYMSIFDKEGRIVQPTVAEIIDENSFDRYNGQGAVVLFGSGADKFQEMFDKSHSVQVDRKYRHSSRFMATIAIQKLNKQEVEDLIYFEPFYLKEFVPTLSKK